MKIQIILAAVAASIILTGCFQDVHEHDLSKNVGYVAPELQWANPADAGTDIHDLQLVVDGPGVSYTRHFADPRAFSSELLELPAGEYDILIIANASESDGFRISGLPAAKAGALGPIAVSLAGKARNQAWFSPSTFTVEQDVVNTEGASLQRLLTTLTLEFRNVPAGSVLNFTLSGVATSIILNEKDAGGRYGVPGGESSSYVLGTLTGNGRQTFYCFPTISGQSRVVLSVEVTPPGEPPYTCVCEVPALSTGKEYMLTLDYNQLSTYMYVAAHTINEWTEGWTISGDIFNPEQ